MTINDDARPGPGRLAQGGREAALRARDVTCKALLPLFLALVSECQQSSVRDFAIDLHLVIW